MTQQSEPLEITPPARRPCATYIDPLEVVWLTCAREIGWRIERSGEVFASWDGRKTLTIGVDAELDPDDHLGQMILHEICHALIEGPQGWGSVDWGLENRDARDLDRELATHRLQAAWSDHVNLRGFFAITTDWRTYYDLLGTDPFKPLIPDALSSWRHAWSLDESVAIALDTRAVNLARSGARRAHDLGWHRPLINALNATSTLAELVRAHTPVSEASSSLWGASEMEVRYPPT